MNKFLSGLNALVCASVALLCGGAWAATPVAVWDGDFDVLNKDGYTLNLNGNPGTKDSITIGSKGIKVTIPGKGFENYMGSIIVQYSGVTAYPSATKALATFDSNRGQDYTGVCVRNAGDVYGVLTGSDWENKVNVSSGKIPLTEGSHRLGFIVEMTSSNVKRRGTHACIDGTSVYSVGGLVGSETIVTGFCIGGEDNTTLGSLEGMIIEKIAVFNDALTNDEVTNFKFPSETTYYTATVSSDVTWANLTWNDSQTWGNDNSCDATISVTADAKLTIGAAVTAKKVTFDIAEGKTLTLAGNNAITTSDNIYVTGPGTIKFTRTTNGFTPVGGTIVKFGLSAESTAELYTSGDHWNYSGCNFNNVTGSGLIKLTADANSRYHLLPNAANMWPTTHSVENTLTGGMILSQHGVTYELGSLSGAGHVRVDYNTPARYLTLVQSSDSVWSGQIYNSKPERLGSLTVKGANGAKNKTLTFTGSQDQAAVPLNVDASGSLKLNGTWKGGAVALNGEFGGTGTITDAATITVGAGAKIRADWGVVMLNKAPTMGALVDVVATEAQIESGKVKLFGGTSFTQPDRWTTAYARVLVGETVQYGTVAVEADGVYATISEEAMTAAMDAAAKYKYEMNGSFENSGHDTALEAGTRFASGDFADGKLNLGTNVGNHYGAGFSFGSGSWTIVTAVKAPAQDRCIFGVGGQKGTAGMVGLRSAGSSQIKLFTSNGADLCGVTLSSDPTAAFHVYAIVYENGTIKMNVDGGAFCDAVPFTPSSAGQWQIGGVHSGCPNGMSNAGSGQMDCFRMYSFPFVKADTQTVAAEFIGKAAIGDVKYFDLTTALKAAKSSETVTLLADATLDAAITIPEGVTLDIGSVTVDGTINVYGSIAGNGIIKNLVMVRGSTVVMPSEGYLTVTNYGKFQDMIFVENAPETKPVTYMKVAAFVEKQDGDVYSPMAITFRANGVGTIGKINEIEDEDGSTLLKADIAVAGFAYQEGIVLGFLTVQQALDVATLMGGSYVNVEVYDENADIPEEYVLVAGHLAIPQAKIGEKGYATLAAALDAAEANDTVTLLAANEETVTIPANVTVDVNGQAFTGTVKGAGKIKFAGFAPIKDATALKNSLKDENNWTGTLVITQPASGQIGASDGTVGDGNGTLLNNYGNVNSKIEFLNCTYSSSDNLNYFGKSYVDGGAGDVVVQPEIVVTGEFKLNNGYSQTEKQKDLNNYTIFRKLSGTGTITSTYATQLFVILDGSDFSGAIDTTHKKFIFGPLDANDRTADGQPAAGAVVVKEGNSVTIGAGKTWTAGGGMKVDGTLKFTEDASSLTAITRNNQFSLSGSGLIDLSTAKGQNAGANNLRIAIRGANHTFTGNVNVPANVNLVFGAANTDCSGMSFSGGGFVCVLGTSANLNGTWTTGTGAYVGTGATLNANGGTLTGRLYFCNNSNLALGSLTETSLTVSGERFETAGTVHITLPSGEPANERTRLISWNAKRDVTAAKLDVTNVPTGYETAFDDTGLYLLPIAYLVETRTTDVSNNATMNALYIDANGVQKFTGTGGVQAYDLQMRADSLLVIDPIKNPLYVTRATPTFAAGAKIKLDAAYAGKKGTAMLMVWEGEAEPKLPENLFDTETYPNSALSFKHYTSDLQSNDSSGNVITTVAKTMTALMVDLDATYPKKPLKIMPLGDSITEGTNQVGFGNPNYRMFLLAKLAIEGYDVSSTGFRRVKTMNAAGAAMPNEWCWHNGVSGQRLCSSSTRAGWRDALEPTLDASEIPDVITFKIGTNDQGTNVEQLYAEWVAVMNRIIAARPSTKIIVGSIMDIVRNDNWENDWNLKLKDAIEQNTPGFPANQVFFADLNKANPRNGEGGAYLGTFYSSTDLHPNWIGHEKNAQCWADAIIAALAEDKALTAKYEPNLKTGALANVAPEYLKGFVKLATFKPNNAAIKKNATPTYAAKANIDSNAKITKVGYYMELKNSRSGNVRWVWADMDNWNAEEADKVFSKIEIPSAYTYQGEANNLHVDTNDGGIEKILPTVEGKKAWLQFCRGGAGNGGNVSGAPGNFFGWDWNDQMNDGGSYGIMQLYRVAPTVVEGGVAGDNSRAAQVLMAFNRFSSANGQEIGIGNCAIHGAPKTAANVTTTVNYMYTTEYERLNLASYDLATIEIWGVVDVDGKQYVMPDAPALEVEAATAEKATAACTVVTDAAADSEAGQGGQAQFLTLKATRVGDSNNWKVVAIVDNEKLPENKKINNTAIAFANAGGIMKLAGATEMQTISIPKENVTPGLYYSISFGTTPDNHTQESERVLATSDEGTVDIRVPALGNEKVYYIRVKASATK